jgi:drug/metabolite transporter (DMT)-like permease
LPASVRAPLLMMLGCVLFSVMGALVKYLGQRLDLFQIAFFRCFFGFVVTLPFVLRKTGHRAFRTTHPWGHFLRGALGFASMIAGFYATTHLPLTDSTAISFTTPLFMILTAIFLLGETVRWRRGLATLVGFVGVLVMVRPGSEALDPATGIGLFAALLVAVSTTLVKRLSATEAALTILLWFGLVSSVLAAVPVYFTWTTPTRFELLLFGVIGVLGAVGQFFTVRAYAIGELTAIAPIDYSRLVFAGVMGYLMFAELPDQYTLVGALIIVASTLYIARREAHLSRTHRASLARRLFHPHPHDPHPHEAPAEAAAPVPALPAAAVRR